MAMDTKCDEEHKRGRILSNAELEHIGLVHGRFEPSVIFRLPQQRLLVSIIIKCAPIDEVLLRSTVKPWEMRDAVFPP